MAQSDVEIANLALTKIGQKTIISLDDPSDTALLVKTHYNQSRKATLRAYPWRFALKRAQLGALATPPIWGFTQAYQLPPDALWVVATDFEIDNPEQPWSIEGRTLVTDVSSPIKILYVADITDPVLFDDLFTEAFSERLAAEIVFPITKRVELRANHLQIFQLKLEEAKSVDAQQGSPDKLLAQALIDIRS